MDHVPDGWPPANSIPEAEAVFSGTPPHTETTSSTDHGGGASAGGLVDRSTRSSGGFGDCSSGSVPALSARRICDALYVVLADQWHPDHADEADVAISLLEDRIGAAPSGTVVTWMDLQRRILLILEDFVGSASFDVTTNPNHAEAQQVLQLMARGTAAAADNITAANLPGDADQDGGDADHGGGDADQGGGYADGWHFDAYRSRPHLLEPPMPSFPYRQVMGRAVRWPQDIAGTDDDFLGHLETKGELAAGVQAHDAPVHARSTSVASAFSSPTSANVAATPATTTEGNTHSGDSPKYESGHSENTSDESTSTDDDDDDEASSTDESTSTDDADEASSTDESTSTDDDDDEASSTDESTSTDDDDEASSTDESTSEDDGENDEGIAGALYHDTRRLVYTGLALVILSITSAGVGFVMGTWMGFAGAAYMASV